MNLVFSLLILFLDFVSFYIYNLDYIDKSQTKRERKNRSHNIFYKMFFIDTFKISNKFFWVCNLINIVVSFLGILWSLVNIFLANEQLDNLISGVLLLWMVFTAIFTLISKLIIHIVETNKVSSKVFLLLYLIVFMFSICIVFISSDNQ